MAYPLAQMPTWADFRDRLVKNHNCTLGELEVDGAKLPYLERLEGAETFVAVAQAFADDKRLTPSVIRSICARLGLDVKLVEPAFTLG